MPEGMVGASDFNLTLVNRMEPNATGRKNETEYGMGKVSVGWHRDSGLKDYSSIAVYQSLSSSSGTTTTKTIVNDDGWGVALRAMDGGAGGPLSTIPPLLVPLPSGSIYYMLDDFNHNHEHAVISPSTTKKMENTTTAAATTTTIRYSSTHRVAREGRGTWQYIRDKARGIVSIEGDSTSSRLLLLSKYDNTILLPSKKEKDAFVSHIRAQQNIMTEIEFEWLRQWFVQGKKHASLHPYWHKPILELCTTYCKLERMTCEILHLLNNFHNDKNNASGQSSSSLSRGSIVTEDLFDVLIESFTERSALRATWRERYSDPIYTDIPEDERPFSCECLDRMMDKVDDNDVRSDMEKKEGRLSEDLDMLISKLRRLRLAFVSIDEQKSNVDDHVKSSEWSESKKKRKLSNSGGSLTKKESKQRASNWERLKATLKR
jgi:alpha-ketoglutarate-dependent dioxygenase FTO